MAFSTLPPSARLCFIGTRYPHETKGTRAADFFYKRSAREIHGCALGAITENRVIEIDLEAHLEPFERDESGAFAIFHCHFTQDHGAQDMLRRYLNQEPMLGNYETLLRTDEFHIGS